MNINILIFEIAIFIALKIIFKVCNSLSYYESELYTNCLFFNVSHRKDILLNEGHVICLIKDKWPAI